MNTKSQRWMVARPYPETGSLNVAQASRLLDRINDYQGKQAGRLRYIEGERLNI